jgi:hypothetical protein
MAHRALQLLANEPAQRLNPGRWERRIGEMTAVVIRHYGGRRFCFSPERHGR